MKLIIVFAALMASLSVAAAQDFTVELNKKEITIDHGFDGGQITVTGEVSGLGEEEAPGDLIIIVQGPNTDMELRAKKRVAGIWIAGDPVVVKDAPSFYFVVANRPFESVLAGDDKPLWRLDASFDKENTPSIALRTALEDFMRREALYVARDDAVTISQKGSFKAVIDFPANTPLGEYQVSVYLARNGAVVSERVTSIRVEKIGMERYIYDMSRDRPFAYGSLCVFLSLFAGWGAAAAFKK